jgi:hypothetical protein
VPNVTESGGSGGSTGAGHQPDPANPTPATPPSGGSSASEPTAELPRWQPFADVPAAPPSAPPPALPDEATLTPAPDTDAGSLVPDQMHDAPAYIPPAIGMTSGAVIPPPAPAEVPTSAWITTSPEVVKQPARGRGLKSVIGTIIGLVVVAVVAAGVFGLLPSDKGKVLFGTAIGKDLCTVNNKTTTVNAADPIFFSAVLKHHMDGNQAITLHITKDGKDLVNYDEPADGTAFDCYGNRESLGPLEAGLYRFEVIHNGEVEATGDLTVR